MAETHSWPSHFQPAVVETGFGGGKLSSFCLALEAWRRGLEVSLLGPDGTRTSITDGVTEVTFNHSRSDRISAEAHATVESKFATAQALRAAGVPAPESRCFQARETDVTDIVSAAEELGFPVVLKPVQGSVGRGILANLQGAAELEAGYRHLVDDLQVRRIVLERHHFGSDYRIFVSGGRCQAAVLRDPANVVGDGVSTVDELIAAKNRERGKNPFLSGGLIAQDYEVMGMLARSGHELDSVPADGERIVLRQKANASAGGDVIDVTDSLPQRLQDTAVAAVEAVPGLPAAGVDLLWDEEGGSAGESDVVVIELNGRSHIGVNMYPTRGTGRDLPEALVDEYFPQSPRREGRLFADLTFDRREAVAPLLTGISSSVILANLPAHGFPVRREYSVTESAQLTGGGRVSLKRLARKLGVVCEVRFSGTRPSVAIAAEDEAALRRMHRALTRELGEAPRRIGRWRGPLYVGFRVLGE